MNQVYKIVTDQILEAMQSADSGDWRAPWRSLGTMPLRSNGEGYRGINVLLLSLQASKHGFESPYWFTFNEAKRRGAYVRKGEKSSLVTFYKRYAKENEKGEEEERFALRYYRVFNASQIEGLPGHYFPARPNVVSDLSIEPFAEDCGATIEYSGSRACYIPATDVIRMPSPDRFESQAGFDGTLAHELVHWSGGSARLNRLSEKNSFGSEGYAHEELIAELGATFLCAQLGKEYRLEHHASYLASWIKLLKGHPRAIVRSASQAQRAVDFLLERSQAARLAA